MSFPESHIKLNIDLPSTTPFIIYFTQSVGFIKKLIRMATGKIPPGELPSQANYEISKLTVTTIKWQYSILEVGGILKGRFETLTWNELGAVSYKKF